MRVLLVEDDELVGDGVKYGLAHAGWTVDWVRDGCAAQAAFQSDQFDVVILDLGLPKKSGLEVLAELRERGERVPVLILTARDGVRERVTGLDAGADDYLVKPFDLDELAARLRALQRRALGPAERVLRCGDIVLDPAARLVTSQGEAVELAPREFSLLQTLMGSFGRVVTRRRLMDSLYGWEGEVESNTLEVHIHNLRKKLPDLPLKTVRGLGYKIE